MTSLETKQLFDADLKGLLEYTQSGGHRRGLTEYARVMFNFLTGRIKELRESVSRLERLAECEGSHFFAMLAQLGYLRIEFLEHAIKKSSINGLLHKNAKDSVWGAEIQFVAAMCFERIGDNSKALEHYNSAAKIWNRFDCPKKSIDARLNAISTQCRIHPSRRFLVEYHFIYESALSLDAKGVAGVALCKISQEYHSMGALSLSLKTANQAIRLLDHDFGTQPFYMALLHRCDVLLDLGRKDEALLDFQKASISEFKEVHAVIKVLSLREKLSGSIPLNVYKELLPSWKERVLQISDRRWFDRKRFAGLEEEFVKITTSGPKTKYDIIISLYGKNIDYSSAEGRFKNLLVRMKKKYPGLIVFQDGKYGISDEVMIAGIKKERGGQDNAMS